MSDYDKAPECENDLDALGKSLDAQNRFRAAQRRNNELDFQSQVRVDSMAQLSQEWRLRRTLNLDVAATHREIHVANEALRLYEDCPSARPAFDEAGVPEMAAAMFARLLTPKEDCPFPKLHPELEPVSDEPTIKPSTDPATDPAA